MSVLFFTRHESARISQQHSCVPDVCPHWHYVKQADAEADIGVRLQRKEPKYVRLTQFLMGGYDN